MRSYKILLFLCLSLVSTTKAWCILINHIFYELNVDRGTATVKGGEDWSPDHHLVIPESVTYNSKTYIVDSLADFCFMHYDELVKVTLPPTATKLGAALFYDCTSLESVNIPEGVTALKGFRFYGRPNERPGYDSPMVETRGMAWIQNYGFFQNCKALREVSLPNTLKKIDSWTFMNCTSLEHISLPESITDMGGAVFYHCSSLKAIRIPSKVKELSFANVGSGMEIRIAGGFFEGCTSLDSVSLPDSLEKLGNFCFTDCTGLTTITLPATTEYLGGSCLTGCSNLQSVTCKAVSPPYLYSNFFTNISHLILYVPKKSIEAYKNASVWEEFGAILPIRYTPSGIDNVHKEDFKVSVVNGTVHLQGVKEGSVVTFYGLDGKQLLTEHISNGQVSIPSLCHQTVIMKVGKLTKKINL